MVKGFQYWGSIGVLQLWRKIHEVVQIWNGMPGFEAKSRNMKQAVVVMWQAVVVMWQSCEVMWQAVVVMWQSCEVMWQAVVVMWQSCDSHVTVMWRAVVVMWQSCISTCDHNMSYWTWYQAWGQLFTVLSCSGSVRLTRWMAATLVCTVCTSVRLPTELEWDHEDSFLLATSMEAFRSVPNTLVNTPTYPILLHFQKKQFWHEWMSLPAPNSLT